MLFHLAILSAIGLMAIDVAYVSRRVIAPVYLIDAVIEIVALAILHANGSSP